LNRWTSGSGDALSAEDIESSFNPNLTPEHYAQGHNRYVMGLDLAVTRDNAAAVVLAVPEYGGKVRLAEHRLWQPTERRKVDLMAVLHYVLDAAERFRLEGCWFDPWQAELLAAQVESLSAQRPCFRRKNWAKPFVREVPATGSNLREMAGLLLEYFNDHKIQFYPCPELRADLLKLRIEERAYGFRLVSPRDASGHGDLTTALGLALLGTGELTTHRPVRAGAILVERGSPLARLQRHERELAELDSQVSERKEGFLRAMAERFGRSYLPRIRERRM